MPLRIMIVEDEPLSRMYLSSVLTESFPACEIVATATTENEAVAGIAALAPDLVFLDIELQAGSGFGVVNRLDSGNTQIIFTTALEEYATNLLRLSGVPYIQKPIDMESLQHALQGAGNPGALAHNKAALDHLRSTMQNNWVPLFMMIVSEDPEPRYVALKDIISIEGIGKESRIRQVSGADITMKTGIKELADLLERFGFFRTQMQHIINVAQVRDSRNAAQGTILMANNIEVPVSPKKLAELRQCLTS